MYSLIKYSYSDSTYSDAAGSLRVYFKDKAGKFDANIRNNNAFKSFECKA